MPSLKKLLKIGGFGLGTLMILFSLGATPSKPGECANEELKDDEEEQEEQRVQEKSPTGFYDYDAAAKTAYDNIVIQYNVNPAIVPPFDFTGSFDKEHGSVLSNLCEHEEHVSLLQHLNEEVGEHPPMGEEEELKLKGEELMDELEQENKRRRR